MAITGTVLPNTQMAFSDGKKDIFKMQYSAMSSNVFDIYMAGMAITGTVLPNTQMAFSDGNKDIFKMQYPAMSSNVFHITVTENRCPIRNKLTKPDKKEFDHRKCRPSQPFKK